MKRKLSIFSVLATLSLSGALIGCGGAKGDGGGSGDPLSRTIITGDGDKLGGTRFTTKKWKILAIKASSSYTPSGADQPCPATVTLKADSSTTVECRANSFLEFRSDGKLRQYDGAGTDVTFSDSWDFSADVLNIVAIDSGSTDLGNYTAINEGIVSGKQRIRVRTITHTSDGVAQPEDIGNEVLIEEVL